VRTIVTWAQ